MARLDQLMARANAAGKMGGRQTPPGGADDLAALLGPGAGAPPPPGGDPMMGPGEEPPPVESLEGSGEPLGGGDLETSIAGVEAALVELPEAQQAEAREHLNAIRALAAEGDAGNKMPDVENEVPPETAQAPAGDALPREASTA